MGQKYLPWHLAALKSYERSRNQSIAIYCLCGLCVVLGWGTFENRSEVKTVIVRTGGSGAPIAAAVADAEKLPALKAQEILRTVADLTEWWRVKTTDVRNERRQFARLFAHLTPAASNKIQAIISGGNLYPWLADETEYNPLTDVGEFTADVEYVSISQIGGNTYQARYRETIYNENGSVRMRYILTINYTLEQRRPETVQTVQRNPYGLFVTDLSATIEREFNQ